MEIIEIEGHPVVVDNLNRDSVVFDCGACIGNFTYPLMKKYKCNFILYEPDFRNYRRLVKRFKEHINITVINKAIYTVGTEKEFYLGDFITASSLYKSHRGLGKLSYIAKIANLNDEICIPIDLLKLDLEGAEVEVIPNLNKDTLLKIKQITVEFHLQSKIDGYTQEKIDVCRNYLKELFDEVIYVDKGNDGHHGLYLNKL